MSAAFLLVPVVVNDREMSGEDVVSCRPVRERKQTLVTLLAESALCAHESRSLSAVCECDVLETPLPFPLSLANQILHQVRKNACSARSARSVASQRAGTGIWVSDFALMT